MSPHHDSLSLLDKPPRVRWSRDMRIVLCCLKEYYIESQADFQAIFNKLFEQELAEFGFRNGRSVRWLVLNSQWTYLKYHKDRTWTDVHQNPNSAWQLSYLKMIEETAASLYLQLTKKDQYTRSSSSIIYHPDTPVSFRPPETSSPLQDHHEPIPVPRVEAQDIALASEQTPAGPSLCTAGGKACLWCYTEELNKEAGDSLDTARTPPLLYRWYNVDSQGTNSKTMFVAGLFSDVSQSYFEPETIGEDEFFRAFENHIRRKHIPSLFISTFKSALAPVHRSLHNQEGASIAIIDSTKLKSRVFSAKDFIQKHKLKFESDYNGAGEYLVWGNINSEALVCTFKITTLERIAEENPDISRLLQLDTIAAKKRNRRGLHQAMAKTAVTLDKRAGATVGKLLSLLEVPEEYCREVSEGMAYSWRIKTRRLPWGEFFEGVKLGFRGQPVLDPPTPGPSPLRGVDLDIDSDDSDTYSIDDMSDDNGRIEIIAAQEDNDVLFMNDAHPEETPTPAPRSRRQLGSPIRFEALEMQNVSINDPSVISISSDEELIDVAEEIDPFHEGTHAQEQMVPTHEQMPNDPFASERARVMAVLREHQIRPPFGGTAFQFA